MAQHQDATITRESEEFLSNIVSGLSGLLGEGEDEFEDEFEDELESAREDEEFLGPLLGVARNLLGGDGEVEAEEELEGRFESEYEDELEDELEGMAAAEGEEEGEEFFRGVGRFFKRAAPFLRRIAKVAAPLVATAVGGPAAGALARAVTSQLEGEAEGEEELEAAHREATSRPLSEAECEAEALAAMAAHAESESEAEALMGAATARVLLSRSDRRALRRLLPAMARGGAAITRLLYGSRMTRPAVRVVPTIMADTAATLLRHGHGGRTADDATVGRVMAAHTSRVLSDHRRCRHALARHGRGVRRYRSIHGGQSGHSRLGGYGPAGYRGHGGRGGHGRHGGYGPAGHRGRGGHVGNRGHGHPFSGGRGRAATTIRVATPVRIPAGHGRPSHVVRVVTRVPVPRGAVPASRTATVSGGTARRAR